MLKAPQPRQLLKKVEKTIKLPVINGIDSPSPDELPLYTTLTEAKKVILECDHIINDMELQERQKQASVLLAQISGDEDLYHQKLAELELWMECKAVKKLRTTKAKKFIYQAALLEAGVEI